VSINHHTALSGPGGLEIGNFVMMGSNCNILTSNHNFDKHDVPMMFQGTKPGKVVIKDDVWLGANVIILPNVTVGRGSIIAAGAVVNKDVPDFSIVGGVPAKVLKYRFSPDTIKKAQKSILRKPGVSEDVTLDG